MPIARQYYSGGSGSSSSLTRSLRSAKRKNQQIEDATKAYEYRFEFITPQAYSQYVSGRAEQEKSDGDTLGFVNWTSKGRTVEKRIRTDERQRGHSEALFNISLMGDDTLAKTSAKIDSYMRQMQQVNTDNLLGENEKYDLLLGYETQLNNAEFRYNDILQGLNEKALAAALRAEKQSIQEYEAAYAQNADIFKRGYENARTEQEAEDFISSYYINNRQAIDILKTKEKMLIKMGDFDGAIRARTSINDKENDTTAKAADTAMDWITDAEGNIMRGELNGGFVLLRSVDAVGNSTTEIKSFDQLPADTIQVGGFTYKIQDEMELVELFGQSQAIDTGKDFIRAELGATGLSEEDAFREWALRKGIDTRILNDKSKANLMKEFAQAKDRGEKIDLETRKEKAIVPGTGEEVDANRVVPEFSEFQGAPEFRAEAERIKETEGIGSASRGGLSNFLSASKNIGGFFGEPLTNIGNWVKDILSGKQAREAKTAATQKAAESTRRKLRQAPPKAFSRPTTSRPVSRAPSLSRPAQAASATGQVIGGGVFTAPWQVRLKEFQKAYRTGGQVRLRSGLWRGNKDFFREEAGRDLRKLGYTGDIYKDFSDADLFRGGPRR